MTQKQERSGVSPAVAHFDALPDSARVDIKVVSTIRNRSAASIWRDVRNGRFPPPIKCGVRSTRWIVGDIRRALEQEQEGR